MSAYRHRSESVQTVRVPALRRPGSDVPAPALAVPEPAAPETAEVQAPRERSAAVPDDTPNGSSRPGRWLRWALYLSAPLVALAVVFLFRNGREPDRHHHRPRARRGISTRVRLRNRGLARPLG